MAPKQSRLVREARRGLSRFRNMRPASLARTLWRAGRMALTVPARPDVPARAERVVVSLTTIPARARSLGPCLRSLIDQSEPADRILLALPHVSSKGEPYPSAADLGLPDGVDILRCEDQGPATKFLPALDAEPDAVLIVVDDDVIYPRRFIETLLREHRLRPDVALGFRGVRLKQGVPFAALDHVLSTGIAETTPVDVLFGTWGYLLPPRVLGPDVHDFADAPPEVRFVDDVWISGHLARAGIRRFVAPSAELPIETWSSFRQSLTRGVNRSGKNDETALKHFGERLVERGRQLGIGPESVAMIALMYRSFGLEPPDSVSGIRQALLWVVGACLRGFFRGDACGDQLLLAVLRHHDEFPGPERREISFPPSVPPRPAGGCDASVPVRLRHLAQCAADRSDDPRLPFDPDSRTRDRPDGRDRVDQHIGIARLKVVSGFSTRWQVPRQGRRSGPPQ